MTKYAGSTAVVIVAAPEIRLAIAKRLVEGGARVILTAATADQRTAAAAELGSAARVVAPAGIAAGPGDEYIDLAFTDAVTDAEPLLPRLRDGGAVVLTTSTSAAAVRALAAALTSRGIRVNAVTPLRSRGRAEEVARVALFLATEATCTTGAHIPVDGGFDRRRPPSQENRSTLR
jgi:NAD(P)-dependent dehydrogenase (short-subunit alcohol dehydrogenase family)